MAEGWLRHLAPGECEANSAGIEAQGKNPRAIETMRLAGVDISSQRSKSISPELLAWADVLVTVCGHADEHCPSVSAGVAKHHWPLSDPAQAQGDERHVGTVFAASRDEIKHRVAGLVAHLRESRLAESG